MVSYELQGFRLVEGGEVLVVRRDEAGWLIHDEDGLWELVPDEELDGLLDAIDRAVLSGSTEGLPEVLAERSSELLSELGLRLDQSRGSDG